MRSCLPLYFLYLCFYFSFVTSGILRTGNPLKWSQSLNYLTYVRRSGVRQFINQYKRSKDLVFDPFLWGDEIEYGVFEDINGKLDLTYCGTFLRQKLTSMETEVNDLPMGCEWQPEYGSWMIEVVPRNPYGSYLEDLLTVEKSMNLRRKRLHFALNKKQIAPSVSIFPMLGVENYNHSRVINGETSNSAYISDDTINPHPRFGTLTRNIRERRGSNVNITVLKEGGSNGSIHMDAMAFGMGCCCLQITMQCSTERQSRYLHDQLAVLSPILQCLSAATPILKGQLADTDTRWDVISQAVDDRTPMERGISGEDRSEGDIRLAGKGIKPLGISDNITIVHNA